jgi:ABC-2 type transport system permease protein
LFFASNAIYPVVLMPGWLKAIAEFNPLTYLVDALRQLMIIGGVASYTLEVDYLILFAVFVVLIIIASRMYIRLIH